MPPHKQLHPLRVGFEGRGVSNGIEAHSGYCCAKGRSRRASRPPAIADATIRFILPLGGSPVTFSEGLANLTTLRGARDEPSPQAHAVFTSDTVALEKGFRRACRAMSATTADFWPKMVRAIAQNPSVVLTPKTGKARNGRITCSTQQ